MSFGRSLLHFFIFILRFWNHILICLSVRFRSLATSYLRSRERYILNRNSFSSSRVWCLVYGQRFFLVDFACSQLDAGLSARRVGERELVMLPLEKNTAAILWSAREKIEESNIKATIQFWYAEIGKHNLGIHASGLRVDLYERTFYVQAIIFFLATGNFGITEWGTNNGLAVYKKKKISEIQIVCFMATIVRLYPYILRNI